MANNKPSGPVLGNLPVITEPRCNICKSSSRRHVDKLLAAGFSYLSIAEELEKLDDDFKGKKIDTIRKNVERHSKGHVNIKDRAVRQIIEKRALEQGILVDEVSGQLTGARSLYDLIVAKGHDQLADPDQRVRFTDVIEAAKLLEETQRQEYVHKAEVMQRQVWCISEALRRVLGDNNDLLQKIITEAEFLFANPDSGNVTTLAKEIKA